MAVLVTVAAGQVLLSRASDYRNTQLIVLHSQSRKVFCEAGSEYSGDGIALSV
jgi:hypothetical protein